MAEARRVRAAGIGGGAEAEEEADNQRGNLLSLRKAGRKALRLGAEV